MCLAVPAEVVSMENGVALCRVGGEGGSEIKASLMLLEHDPEPGDFLIVHAGFALRIMDLQEAREAISILREMAETMDQYVV